MPVMDTDAHQDYWINLSHILEKAYGYHEADISDHHFRKAPSAGAIYPIEIVVIPPTNISYQSVIYHFESGNFHQIGEIFSDQKRLNCGIDAEDTLIVELALFKQTVRCYGFRGYRYCLLDAGAVMVNVVGVAQSMRISVSIQSGEILNMMHEILHLEKYEAALTCLVLSNIENSHSELKPIRQSQLSHVDTPKKLIPYIQNQANLQHILAQISKFHLQSIRGLKNKKSKLLVDQKDPIRSVVPIDQRYSAKDFSTFSMDPSLIFNALFGLWRTIDLPYSSDVAPLQIYVLCFSMQGYEEQILRFTAKKLVNEGHIENLQDHFYQACKTQDLLQRCSFAVVIAAPKTELYVSPVRYRQTCLNAGFLDMLQQYVATELNIVSTCIGEFDDEAVAHLLKRKNLTPIVIHAFGKAK